MNIRQRSYLGVLTVGLVLSLAPTLLARQEPRPMGATVPFKMLPTNHMVVEAKLNGKGPYRLVFDLGAPITLLSSKAAEASGAVDKDAPKSFLFGMRGESKVDTLQVGDLKAEHVPVVVMDHPALKALGDALNQPLDGIIGYTFFARYKVSIDYQAHRMVFTPVDSTVRDLMKDLPDRLLGPKVAKSRVVAPRGLWGLTPGEPTDLGVPIKAVLAGSPAADAGLQPGDVLTTLGGRWTTTIADTYAAAAAVPPGQAAPVVVLRDEKEQTLTVTPKDGL
ncbi:MAG: aspartyl protease family protein [Isosphaeraceae bacterium]